MAETAGQAWMNAGLEGRVAPGTRALGDDQRRYRIARIGVGPAPVAGFSASGHHRCRAAPAAAPRIRRIAAHQFLVQEAGAGGDAQRRYRNTTKNRSGRVISTKFVLDPGIFANSEGIRLTLDSWDVASLAYLRRAGTTIHGFPLPAPAFADTCFTGMARARSFDVQRPGRGRHSRNHEP